MILQAPSDVVMIRPHKFHPNPDTLSDNAFQSSAIGSPLEISTQAQSEFNIAVSRLRNVGITVHDFDDMQEDTPDSVFPNNWFSTHTGGHIAIYPMHAKTRRRERRWDIIDMLKAQYRVQDIIDYSGLEQDGLALEGTGAMVLDHIGRVAYVARSNRADPILLERFCTNFNYEPIVFDACDKLGNAIYHTNVLMTIGTGYALIGLDLIANEERRKTIYNRLTESGHEIVELSEHQISEFCGNAFEMTGTDGTVLALSQRALNALTPKQISIIEKTARLLPLKIPTIETAGGSVRCMIAGLHLAKRS